MHLLDIGEVANTAGVSAATLRYYEERGLIAAAGRKGLRRQYAPSVLERLALISLGQRAGFSLEDIQNLLPSSPLVALDRDRLRSRAEEIDARVRELKSLAAALRHTADCPAPNHGECPTFRRMMKAALKRPKAKGRRPL